MPDLRIGVIGLGYIGRLHARAWAANSGARVVAVADPNPASRESAPDGARWFGDHRALLAENLDAVSICSPTHLHREMTIDALDSGKHVLLEKPIAVDMEEAGEIVAAAQRAGKLLFVGMTHRFYPELREAKRLLDEGAIGRLIMCRDSILEHLGMLTAPSWYLDKAQAGGGVVLSSGIHLVDRLRWFTGEEITEVAGAASNHYFGKPVEDAAQMFLRFRSGITAEIVFAFASHPRPLVCDLELVGSCGQLTVHTWRGYELDNQNGRFEKTFYTGEPHWQKVLIGLTAEVEEFCAAIRERRAPWPSADESTKALAAVAAFYRAVESGQFERVYS